MGWNMTKISKKLALRLAALCAVTIGLSGCTYGMGLGYYDDGYAYYDCDPYSQFDSYYACDNGYGFYNIGFGGGWYDSYWYPGYGYYIFDNYGRRHNMGDHHRRYWGERRQQWSREHRGRDGRHRGGRDGYGYSNRTDQNIGWPESNGGRRSSRAGVPADTQPQPGAVPDIPRNERGDGRREGSGNGRRDRWQGGNQGAAPAAAPQPVAQPRQPRADNPGRGRGGWQPPANDGARSRGNVEQPAAPRAAPQPRAERPARQAPQTRQAPSRQSENSTRPD